MTLIVRISLILSLSVCLPACLSASLSLSLSLSLPLLSIAHGRFSWQHSVSPRVGECKSLLVGHSRWVHVYDSIRECRLLVQLCSACLVRLIRWFLRWDVTTRMKKMLDENDKSMWPAILNKSLKQYPIKHRLHRHLRLLTHTHTHTHTHRYIYGRVRGIY